MIQINWRSFSLSIAITWITFLLKNIEKILGQFSSNDNVTNFGEIILSLRLILKNVLSYKLALQCKTDIGLIFFFVDCHHSATRIEWNEQRKKCKLNCASAVSFIIILMIDMSMELWFKFKVIQFEKSYTQCKYMYKNKMKTITLSWFVVSTNAGILLPVSFCIFYSM